MNIRNTLPKKLLSDIKTIGRFGAEFFNSTYTTQELQDVLLGDNIESSLPLYDSLTKRFDTYTQFSQLAQRNYEQNIASILISKYKTQVLNQYINKAWVWCKEFKQEGSSTYFDFVDSLHLGIRDSDGLYRDQDAPLYCSSEQVKLYFTKKDGGFHEIKATKDLLSKLNTYLNSNPIEYMYARLKSLTCHSLGLYLGNGNYNHIISFDYQKLAIGDTIVFMTSDRDYHSCIYLGDNFTIGKYGPLGLHFSHLGTYFTQNKARNAWIIKSHGTTQEPSIHSPAFRSRNEFMLHLHNPE